MDDQRLDLSLLDPRRDRAHWSTLVQSVTRRARQLEPPRQEVLRLILCWGRPALAIGAFVALFCWAGATGSRAASGAIEDQAHPSQHLLRWATSGARPATSEILLVLGSDHEHP
jgi:hypothetical protein